MLKSEDRQWLAEHHPELVWDGTVVVGIIEFKAAYDDQRNTFTVVSDANIDVVDGLVLSGRFDIRIQERRDKSISALPAVWVNNLQAIQDRHFNQTDKSACLCSPLVENEFLDPEFRFQDFIGKLVIPFLYGQLFYSLNEYWPWSEYAHGATGLLEAYLDAGDPAKAESCLRQLVRDAATWPKIRTALQHQPHVKGHTLCFCGTPEKIKRCHPRALKGALRLQNDIRERGIPIP